MMIKKEPYLILVFVAILFIALYFFTNFDLNFTINIHDTYFVMSRELVFLFFIVLFGFMMSPDAALSPRRATHFSFASPKVK